MTTMMEDRWVRVRDLTLVDDRGIKFPAPLGPGCDGGSWCRCTWSTPCRPAVKR